MPLPKEIEQAAALLKNQDTRKTITEKGMIFDKEVKNPNYNILWDFSSHMASCGRTMSVILDGFRNKSIADEYEKAEKALKFFKENFPDKVNTIKLAESYLNSIHDQAKLIVGVSDSLNGNPKKVKLSEPVKLGNGTLLEDVYSYSSSAYATSLDVISNFSNELKGRLTEKLKAAKSEIKLSYIKDEIKNSLNPELDFRLAVNDNNSAISKSVTNRNPAIVI